MATTSAGTPYVVSSDTASDYPTVSLALAERVDAVEDKILYSGLRLPGTTGNYVTAPDSSGLDITGDIDIRLLLALDDWTPAATQRLLTKWQTTGQFSYSFYIGTAGNIAFQTTTDGTTATLITGASTSAVTFTNGAAGWIRVTRASSSGDIKFYTAAPYATPTSWTQLGTTVTTTSGSMWSGTSEVSIGARTAGTLEPAAGKFYRAQIYNGIAGTLVADADFRLPAGTRHSDSLGNVWTINGSAWAWTVEAIA